MALYWITECMPYAITGILPVVLFPVLGIMKSEEISPKTEGLMGWGRFFSGQHANFVGFWKVCTAGRTWTGTGFRPRHFKCRVSTIPPQRLQHLQHPIKWGPMKELTKVAPSGTQLRWVLPLRWWPTSWAAWTRNAGQAQLCWVIPRSGLINLICYFAR